MQRIAPDRVELLELEHVGRPAVRAHRRRPHLWPIASAVNGGKWRWFAANGVGSRQVRRWLALVEQGTPHDFGQWLNGITPTRRL